MKKGSKKIKPVRAWAHYTVNGRALAYSAPFTRADFIRAGIAPERIVRVEIRPIAPPRKKRRTSR